MNATTRASDLLKQFEGRPGVKQVAAPEGRIPQIIFTDGSYIAAHIVQTYQGGRAYEWALANGENLTPAARVTGEAPLTQAIEEAASRADAARQ